MNGTAASGSGGWGKKPKKPFSPKTTKMSPSRIRAASGSLDSAWVMVGSPCGPQFGALLKGQPPGRNGTGGSLNSNDGSEPYRRVRARRRRGQLHEGGAGARLAQVLGQPRGRAARGRARDAPAPALIAQAERDGGGDGVLRPGRGRPVGDRPGERLRGGAARG